VISSDLTTWNAGFQTGHLRGRQDIAAEAVGRSVRDPRHLGHPGEPPEGAAEEWIDGFLEGYAAGRREGLRGEVA
jgi:hypothetical protein